MKSIGIDIGSYSIKLVEIESLLPSGFRISMLEEYPLNQDSSKDQSIEVIEILRQLILNRFNLEKTNFVLALRKDQYIYRNLSFPFKQKYKILKVLPFVLADEIPFHQNEVIYELKMMGFKGNESHVMAFVSEKKAVRKTIELAQSFHVSPDVVSAGEIAILNAYEKREHVKRSSSFSFSNRLSSVLDVIHQSLSSKKRKEMAELKQQELKGLDEEEKKSGDIDEVDGDEGHGMDSEAKKDKEQEKKVRILLNLGHKSSFLLLVRGGQVLDLKHFDWGGESIAYDLSKEQGVSLKAALQALQENGFILKSLKGASHHQVKISEIIKRSLMSFLDSLYMSLSQLKLQSHLEYSEMSLSGGVSLIRNIESEFEKYLGIHTFRANENALFQSLDVSDHSEFKASFLVALGLSLEGLKRSRSPPLNFLKGEFEKQNQKFQDFMKKWSKAIQVSCALIVVLFVYSYKKADLTSKISEKSYALMREKAYKVASIKESSLSIESIRKFIRKEEKKNKSKKLMAQFAELNSPLDFLKEFSDNLPPRENFSLNIEDFVLDHKKVFIKGNAPNEKVIDELEEILKKVSKNKEIKKTKTPLVKKEALEKDKVQKKDPLFAFTMEFEVNRKLNQED